MLKNNKLQTIGNVTTIIASLFACILGATFLSETIFLLLVQESMAADVTLLNKILSYFASYQRLHIIFFVLSLSLIALLCFVWYKDRTYKITYFVVGILLLIVLLLIVNNAFTKLAVQTSQLLNQIPSENVFAQGKDFISVIAVSTGGSVAQLTGTILKSLALDILSFVFFLLILVVMIVRITSRNK